MDDEHLDQPARSGSTSPIGGHPAVSADARRRRALGPDRAKFVSGRLLLLAVVVVLGGAAFFVTRLGQNQTVATVILIGVLAVSVWGIGRVFQLIERSVDDRYRELRAANGAWATSIAGSFETTAPLPPAEISAIAFAEDRRLIVPVAASEVVRGEWRGLVFVAMHLSGYEKQLPGREMKGRSASTNIVYVTLPHELPDVRIVDRSLARDYGRPMTTVSTRHLEPGGPWRLESDDPSRSTALMSDTFRAVLNAAGGQSRGIAATGPYLICYGDPVGDAGAIVAQLDLLTALAERIPQAAWLDRPGR